MIFIIAQSQTPPPNIGGTIMNTIHNQETIVKSIKQLFADLLSAQSEGNITDEYKSSVGEALSLAYKAATKNYPGNKR